MHEIRNRSEVAHFEDFFLGMRAPDLRASLNAIATACLRLVTFLPLPDFRVPCFFSCITFSIFHLTLELELDVFLAMLSYLSFQVAVLRPSDDIGRRLYFTIIRGVIETSPEM